MSALGFRFDPASGRHHPRLAGKGIICRQPLATAPIVVVADVAVVALRRLYEQEGALALPKRGREREREREREKRERREQRRKTKKKALVRPTVQVDAPHPATSETSATG